MDRSPPALFFATCRDLVMRRWLQLLAAIAITAAADGVLWVIARKVASSATGASAGSSPDAASSGAPSMVGISIALTIVWAIVVAIMALPMLAATAALTDDDDSPVGWLSESLHAAPAMWVRLALPTFPLLLLGLWMMHGLLGAFASMSESLTTGEEPSKPLSFTVGEALFGHSIGRWLVFAAVLGVWYLWSATRATGTEDQLVPSAPWNLHGRNPLAVVGLVLLSSIVLGPVLVKALKGITPALGEAAGTGSGIFSVVLLGFVLAAFISAVAIPWIALFGDAPAPAMADDGDLGHAPNPTEPDATLVAAAGAPEAPAAAPQVVDLALTSQPGQLTGTWWYLRAGSQSWIQVAGRDGAPPPAPATLDAASQWQTLQPVQQPGAALLVAPADGWYQLGAWVADTLPTQVAIRLTLPADAQPAPQHEAGAA